MSSHSRLIGVFAVIAAGMLPMTAAQAQYYRGMAQPAPLYPYAVQQDQSYTVQQTPNTYVIQRPSHTRDYPYVRGRSAYKPAIVEERETGTRASRDDNKQRVIHADAEVTILGPDRMNIRLFRKGQGPKANARAD
jgi:hypothetical protein